MNPRPPSEASRTRPLKRSLTSKTAALLHKGDFGVLLPPDLTMKKLNSQARSSFKQHFVPLKKVNTFHLFQALKDTIKDTKDVMELVKSGTNLNRKIMRRNSLHILATRAPRPRIFPKALTSTVQQKQESSNDLVSLMREFARRQATAEPWQEPDTIVVEPKVPESAVSPPQQEEEVSRPFELRVSVDSLSRTEMSRDFVDSSASPSYTFVSQYIEQLAPKQERTTLKRKLRGRLVRLAAA